MEQLGETLKNRLTAGKIADQVYTGEALPQYEVHKIGEDNTLVVRELYIRYAANHPDDGLYCLIRYLAEKACPSCNPKFQFAGHHRGCMMADKDAIDTYFKEAMEILRVPGSSELKAQLKAKHTVTNLMKKWKDVDMNDPLAHAKVVANVILDKPSLAELVNFVLFRNGVYVGEDEIEYAVCEGMKMINTQ